VNAAHRSDDDEEQYGKGGDENRCFNFHGHLFVIFFRKERTTSCELLLLYL
jgi:hypothetical protein